jgi:CheY-like chemotaxis protein
MGIKWRFLIVEDDKEMAHRLEELAPSCVDAPDEVETKICETFDEAAIELAAARYDLLILDLKDESDKTLEGDSNPAGLKIFAALKKARFIPVVFYTALAHKVRSEETSFVRVIEKTEDVTKVREAVRKVLSTRLPRLIRHIEEIQRSYMWDFVSKHWKDLESTHEQSDLAYLLARRLALSLQAEAKRLALDVGDAGGQVPGSADVHPMAMYVRPPIASCRLSGDIVYGNVDGVTAHWIVLTPSCDFEQKDRLHNVLLAQCVPLTDQPEFKNWKQEASDKNIGSLKALIGDNRQKSQADRFKFLPGTFFLPDSVVDFQRLKTVTPEQLDALEVVTSLDSPFAESVLAKFSRYFGRLGTPDIDKSVVLDRLKKL